MSAPLETETEYVTFEAKLTGGSDAVLTSVKQKSVCIKDGSGCRVNHAPVIYSRYDKIW